MVREEVKCFRCGEKGHKKWECPNMKKHEKEKAGGCGTTARSVEESEGAQQSEGAASQRSSNGYEGVDNEMGGGDLCGVQKM